jgi:hypothetical protein
VGTLDAPEEVLGVSTVRPSGIETYVLFKEARRRRRRRRVLGGLVACLCLVLAITILAVDGTGGIGGGPVPPSHGHTRPGAPVGHHSPAAEGQNVPNFSGTPFCSNEAIPIRGSAGTLKGTATLLPCYKVNLPSGVRTTTP